MIIEGEVQELSTPDSEPYFRNRPRGSQLGAWASRQSTVIGSRDELEKRYAELEQRWAGEPVPMPDFWGGYRVVPAVIEFWQGRVNRLHDRFRYRRDGGAWVIERQARKTAKQARRPGHLPAVSHLRRDYGRRSIASVRTGGHLTAHGLIDTTEMYLRTIFELEEEGIVPAARRIAERLSQSGPRSARPSRGWSVTGWSVEGDRQLALTGAGGILAVQVMRKHRLAECLLVSVIKMPWEQVHVEACRWEHVISDDVERRLVDCSTTRSAARTGT